MDPTDLGAIPFTKRGYLTLALLAWVFSLSKGSHHDLDNPTTTA